MAEKKDERDALTRFKEDLGKDADMMKDQSERANQEMRFIHVPGGMWEDFGTDSATSINGLTGANAFDDRTKLELDLVSPYRNRFVGQWNQNRIGVEYTADDSDTSDADAELLNGIYRADYRQNSGKMAVDNAVGEVADVGYGCFEIMAFFEDEGDAENDNQRIAWEPIYNAYNTVFWDNMAKRIDKKDARHCTKLIPFTTDGFEERWPGFTPVSAYDPDDLFREHKIIYVGKRYEVVKRMETRFVYNDLEASKVISFSAKEHEKIKDELEADEFKKFVRERKVIAQTIEVTVFSGDAILEETKRIAGKWIPIIPLYGFRAYIDGLEWYEGLVRKFIDSQRLFNMQMSQLAENAATAGQEVPIFTTEQMLNKDIQDIWADKNNAPYLIVDPVTDGKGNIVHMGPIGYSKPPMLDQSTATLLQIVPEHIRNMTGGAPQDTLDPAMSGKALRAIQKREDLNTQTINDNIANAIEWSGEVYQPIAAELYTSRRMISTIGKDGTMSRKPLMTIVQDSESGKVVEASDLRGKKFRVFADVGPQYDTLREQTVEDLKGMLEAMKEIRGGEQYIPAILSAVIENSTGVGLDPIKQLNRKLMIQQGLIQPETEEEKRAFAEFQQQAQQPDPQQKLLDAAATQQEAEARNLDAKAADNVASAELKKVKAEQVLSDIEIDEATAESEIGISIEDSETDRLNALTKRRESIFKTVGDLPLQ